MLVFPVLMYAGAISELISKGSHVKMYSNPQSAPYAFWCQLDPLEAGSGRLKPLTLALHTGLCPSL